MSFPLLVKGKRSLPQSGFVFFPLFHHCNLHWEQLQFYWLASRNEIVLHFLLCKLINYASVKQHLEPLINTCHCFYMTNLGTTPCHSVKHLSLIQARWILTLRGTWKKVEADRRTFHYRFQLLAHDSTEPRSPFPFCGPHFLCMA